MERLQAQSSDVLIDVKVLKPPVGSHPRTPESQRIKEPAAHRLEIKIWQLHVPPLVLPVADQPVFQPSAGDEALALVGSP